MEYDAILSESGGENQDFFRKKNSALDYNNEIAVINGFSSIGLLHKLRETRAFVGFSRWLPDDGKTIEAKEKFHKTWSKY